MSGLGLVVFLALALAALPFTLAWYNVQSLDSAVRCPPSVTPRIAVERFANTAALTDANRPLSHAEEFAYRSSSLLGHDDLGRSLLFRLLLGFLISFAIGLSTALLAVVVGTLWGSIAALAGGWVDWAMMRTVDVLYGLPYILMVILMRVALGPLLTGVFGGASRVTGVVILVLAISSVSWLTVARVIRGQVLSLREMPFFEAARAVGASRWHVLRRHVLPNVIGPMTVYATLAVPQAILQESFLSFLGIGIQQPVPSLGRLAADGVQAVNTLVGFWWLLVFPCAVLVLTLLALNFIGEWVRAAFDPKSSSVKLV